MRPLCRSASCLASHLALTMTHPLQAAKNYHAMLAARALGRLAGVLPATLATPACLPAQEALGKLLTPPLASRLTNPDPRELLSLLNTSVLTPQVPPPPSLQVIELTSDTLN